MRFSSIYLCDFSSRLLLLASVSSAAFLTSCETTTTASRGGTYHVTAHRPNDPSKVRVKVSLSQQNIYVMEGDRLLMAAATTVGFRRSRRRKAISRSTRRSRRNAPVPMVSACRATASSGRGECADSRPLCGLPDGLLVRVQPGLRLPPGLCALRPRSHGCLRFKGEAAAKFYALVRIGTPVNIADTQPEDATIGPKIQRVDDSRTPDPPQQRGDLGAAFTVPSGPLLATSKASAAAIVRP